MQNYPRQTKYKYFCINKRIGSESFYQQAKVPIRNKNKYNKCISEARDGKHISSEKIPIISEISKNKYKTEESLRRWYATYSVKSTVPHILRLSLQWVSIKGYMIEFHALIPTEISHAASTTLPAVVSPTRSAVTAATQHCSSLGASQGNGRTKVAGRRATTRPVRHPPSYTISSAFMLLFYHLRFLQYTLGVCFPSLFSTCLSVYFSFYPICRLSFPYGFLLLFHCLLLKSPRKSILPEYLLLSSTLNCLHSNKHCQ